MKRLVIVLLALVLALPLGAFAAEEGTVVLYFADFGAVDTSTHSYGQIGADKTAKESDYTMLEDVPQGLAAIAYKSSVVGDERDFANMQKLVGENGEGWLAFQYLDKSQVWFAEQAPLYHYVVEFTDADTVFTNQFQVKGNFPYVNKDGQESIVQNYYVGMSFVKDGGNFDPVSPPAELELHFVVPQLFTITLNIDGDQMDAEYGKQAVYEFDFTGMADGESIEYTDARTFTTYDEQLPEEFAMGVKVTQIGLLHK